ncbi:MAG TPA: hypothetical protein PLL57_13390 [Flavobacteriales bacterium]|nr:hypothetical protein [Flavobacteriales bacterium]
MATWRTFLLLPLLHELNATAQFTWTPLAPLPMPTANAAVCAAEVNGVQQVYVFGGITTGLAAANIHQQAFRYDVAADQWWALPTLPDTLGKIAAAASVVGDTAYVIGGYHVFNGPPYELSSDKVHRLDLTTNTWLPDGAAVPVAIDDQVQAVWRDSLIYVITGWSNTANVPNVQVYNPSHDQWSAATPVPNTNQYKAFGASGIIIGDTIYYFGGASMGGNFPAQDRLRIGHIDPLAPMNITWLPAIMGGLGPRYRPACLVLDDAPLWVGGSAVSYNYDAVAYNGSGVVAPAALMQRWDGTAMMAAGNTLPQVMDLRGAGELGNGSYVIAGGIGSAQTVLDSVWLLTLSDVGMIEHRAVGLALWPNPATDACTIRVPGSGGGYILRDALGRSLLNGTFQGDRLHLDLRSLPRGAHVIEVFTAPGEAPLRTRVVRE